MNNHEHQTRNKYIPPPPLKYLSSLVPSSLIFQQPFQQTNILVSVFFTTSLTQQQPQSIFTTSTLSSLIHSHLYPIQSCRRYRNQLKHFSHSNSTVLAESYRKSPPVYTIQLIPLPKPNQQPLSQTTFIQLPHPSTDSTTIQPTSPLALELAFLCQRITISHNRLL